MKTKDKIFISIGSIAIVATIGFGSYSLFNNNNKVTNPVIQPAPIIAPVQSNSTNQTVSPMSNMNMCKDGIYTASASYYVPRGSNTISVNITIKNDIITAVTSDDKYSDGTSAEYIDSFKSELSSAVVGKSITGLNISRVGGASLTSDGFNKTLDIVRTDAAV